MRDFAKLQADTLLVRVIAHAGLAMLFAAILAFLAPFETYRFDGIERLGYWTFQMAAWLVLSVFAYGAIWLWPRSAEWSRVARRVVATSLAALPMMGVTGVANNMMNGWQPDAAEVTELFLAIALIGGTYNYLASRLLALLLTQQRRVVSGGDREVIDRLSPDPAAGERVPTDPTLIERLPPHIRVDILCLQVEDHYVRVHSSQGSAMVLMRFSDALRGLDHIPGAQVHRSWWVADQAVTGMRRSGRTAQLTLSNALSVPVSQPYLAQAMSSWGALEANATMRAV